MDEVLNPGCNNTTFKIALNKEWFPSESVLSERYTMGFDDYKEDYTLSEGLFYQLNKDKYTFSYKGRENKITKRDIILTVIQMFKEYTMPYTKNIVTTEEQLDTEVEHFYFLNKYNLL